MRTIVYQSFRTTNVPSWIARCLDSARDWAARSGHDYAFYDDTFFERVPAGLRPRCGNDKLLLSDYARIAVARELLSTGRHDRAIWIDADALVFDPDNFHIPTATSHAFCREVWLDRIVLGRPEFKLTVNNSVSVFCRDEHIIDFYLDTARRVLATAPRLDSYSIGTDFLVALHRAAPMPLLANVAMFNAALSARYLDDDARILRPFLAWQTSPVAAANLCLSTFSDGSLPDAVVSRLLADRGASLNRHCRAPAYSPTEYTRPVTPVLALRDTWHALRHTLNLMRNAECGVPNGKPHSPVPRAPAPHNSAIRIPHSTL